MPEDKAVKGTTSKPVREPVRDSEGLPVVTARQLEEAETAPSKNAARKAYEEEVAADAQEAQRAADEEAQKKIDFEKKLADRAK